jgi:hypothetical protein
MDMKNSIRIQKAVALLLGAVGLLSMIVAWELLLFAEQYSNTVIFMEMSGVAACMIAYFLWRRAKRMAQESLLSENVS